MYRNLTFFRFDPALNIAGHDSGLAKGLNANHLKPVGPQEQCSRGWVPPLGADEDMVFAFLGASLHLTLGGEDKILPPSVVEAELSKRLRAIEEREGRKLGGRARKQLKEYVVAELLPRALVKPYRLNGYLDLKRGLVVVDTASRAQAEAFVSEIRHALGSFPALPVNAEVSVRAKLTGWVAEPNAMYVDGGLPDGWVLGDECQLQDSAEYGAVVTARHQDLAGDEIAEHLLAGKQVTRLGLVVCPDSRGDRISFTLGEDLVVRKLKFLDGAMAKLEDTEREDMRAELDARATLLVGEVGQLFDTLEQAFRLSKVEG